MVSDSSLDSDNMTDSEKITETVEMVLTDENKITLSRELFNAVRYGIKSQVSGLLEKFPELANITDNQGYTCAHWAAKKGDCEMLQMLFSFGASLNQPTISDAKMMPIHWAASDGKISSLHFLLEKRQDINIQDANGCTPVVIAAQHNQLQSVIYLIKNGADTTLRDNNGDTVLHWGAYKGYVEMVGLLTFMLPHELNSEDTFGQVSVRVIVRVRGRIRGSVRANVKDRVR
jgi:ankyrin repeat protein